MCKTTGEWWHLSSGGLCGECECALDDAQRFRREHFRIPARFAAAFKAAGPDFGVTESLPNEGSGILLTGPVGSGKTHAGYGLLLKAIQQDKRRTAAAYSWPEVLHTMRAGFTNRDIAGEAREIIEALRVADIAMMDDLGAEKVTEGNAPWIQETLFLILDWRWSWEKQTVLTTNLLPNALSGYMGERIASRVLGMCRMVELRGRDRRLP